ncbi:hypothetical protein THAOC_21087 [Thalassiosira oceanica]|uniref:Uncharacterized protein n=1 Tax=Thalassiosira oceanica TaxID=159749 RepID=K0S0E0_THAOC|nr:hypothetical protein THAOC_21087 [Thalassiosira oceanica]|eukprot:EJK58760.1 hypothetical protein THAOC_21087 [Thalassiosira oceanica]
MTSVGDVHSHGGRHGEAADWYVRARPYAEASWEARRGTRRRRGDVGRRGPAGAEEARGARRRGLRGDAVLSAGGGHRGFGRRRRRRRRGNDGQDGIYADEEADLQGGGPPRLRRGSLRVGEAGDGGAHREVRKDEGRRGRRRGPGRRGEGHRLRRHAGRRGGEQAGGGEVGLIL